VLSVSHIFDIHKANEWFFFLKEKGELKALSKDYEATMMYFKINRLTN